jgi:hypothetical protein
MITIEREKLERAIKAMLNSNSTSYEILNAADALNEALAQPVQEPVAKPYAYEFARDNGDETYSVFIERGELIQIRPTVYEYARPKNVHKDHPIKELFDHPPAAQPAQEPVTSGWSLRYVYFNENGIPLMHREPEERNFCPRCGKRTADLTVIHTCTPPEGGHL